jgi:hypothetical protein
MRMTTTALWALALLNAMLLGALAWRYVPENQAVAQARRPGDYLMIPVDFQGARAGVVAVLDQTNNELSAIATEDTNVKNAKMAAMRPVKLTELFDGNRGRGR